MKVENIVLFKRFLKTEGANVLYAGMYKQAHAEDAPEDVEEFLRQVDAKGAILDAFRFPKNSTLVGADYWFDKAIKWEKTLMNSSTSKFYGYCRSNPDKAEKEANVPLSMVTKYLHPLGSRIEEEDGVQRALSSTSAQGRQMLDAWENQKKMEENTKTVSPPVPHTTLSEEQLALSGLKFFDIPIVKARLRLPEGVCSISTNKSYRFSFNREVSKEIRASGCMRFRIAQKGEEKTLYFIFDNDIAGLKWRIHSENVVFSNKMLIVRILDFFGLKGDYHQVAVSKNQSKKDGILMYKVTKLK